MATVNEIVGYVLENLGQVGIDSSDALYTRVRRQVVQTYRVRIPEFVGGPFREGSLVITIGDSGSPHSGDATGIYPWDASLHSVYEPILLDNDELTYYSKPGDFWNEHDKTDTTQGTPESVLVYAKELIIRPIVEPKAGGFALAIFGNFYPSNPADYDATQLSLQLTDAIEHGATVFSAIKEGEDEVQARYIPLWEASLRHLLNQQSTSTRRVPNKGDF